MFLREFGGIPLLTCICVIGNSHLAAMLHAWPKLAVDYPDSKLEFFGQHARFLAEAEAGEDGKLLPGPKSFLHVTPDGGSGRSRFIDTSQYDAFVLFGLAYGPIGVFRTYRRYHYFGLKARRQQSLSRENFKKAARQLICEGAGVHLASLIRRMQPNKPVLLVSTPLPSEEGYTDLVKPSMEPWRTALETGDAQQLMELFGEIAAEVEAMGVTLVNQASATLASPISTLQRFADGAVRLQAEAVRPDDDYEHMSPEYGVAMWRKVMTALDVPSAAKLT